MIPITLHSSLCVWISYLYAEETNKFLHCCLVIIQSEKLITLITWIKRTTVKYLQHFNKRGSTFWWRREQRSTISLMTCIMALSNVFIYLENSLRDSTSKRTGGCFTQKHTQLPWNIRYALLSSPLLLIQTI